MDEGRTAPSPADASADLRVVVIAPTARDAQVTQSLLATAKIACVACNSIDRSCTYLEQGAAALLISEEQLDSEELGLLTELVARQPVWSDLPIIVLARGGEESIAVDRAMHGLGNVTVVERPLRVSTLISLVRSAIRARLRQYQVRDYLAERQRIEEALRAAQQQAESANQAKDRFLAVLSHELRTPLSPVLMTIVAMEQDPQLPEQFRSDIAMVRRNIDLETKLIDDLLDISRVISGKLHLRSDTIGLNELLDQAISVCASDILSKRLNIEFTQRAAGDCISGDTARLQQVFWNLIKNAVKFSAEGGKIVIKSSNPTDRRIRVEVIDQGIGIPADILPRLFNAFEQGDPKITHQFGGMGLGLAISKAIVDLHGGSITATSDGPNRGASFIVEMDLISPPANQASPASDSPNHLQRQKIRLLLVEDHADTCRVMARLLKNLGHTVTIATSVSSAIALADREEFDLVISDIGLPDGTGYDLMQQLRQRHDLSGIALSGYGMEEDIRRSRESGFADHIIKPVNLAQLDAIIRRTSNRQLQSQS